MSGSTWFYRPGSVMTRLGMRVLGPLTVEGLERVPQTGAFIVVANHLSNFDPLIIGATVGDLNDRVIHFMAKVEMQGWPLIGWLATQAGVFFVRRGSGDRGAQRRALEHLAAGRPLAVFPEGHRSRDGQMHEGQAGAALLAMRSGAPILPVAITGTGGLFPTGAIIPRRSAVVVRVGEPFSLAEHATGRIERAELVAATEQIMRTIAAMLPESYRGHYA
jgi:1-acyl-sn-glycerol-3-phosphate acyltransferase